MKTYFLNYSYIMLMAATVLVPSLSHAGSPPTASPLLLGTPVFEGAGCPPCPTCVALSPDAKALSILFQDYRAEAGGSTRHKLASNACRITIPLQVSPGISVGIVKTDIRGFNALPTGGKSRLSADTVLIHRRGPVQLISKTRTLFKGPLDADFTVSQSGPTIVWTRCNESSQLVLSSLIQVKSNQKNDSTSLSVDSLDLAADLNARSHITYSITWRPCERLQD